MRANRITVLEGIGSLQNLSLLTVSCNLLTEIKDQNINILNNLQELGLFGNFLGDENNENENATIFFKLLNTLSFKFPHLHKLYLGGNHFSKIENWKAFIKINLPNLKLLDGNTI